MLNKKDIGQLHKKYSGVSVVKGFVLIVKYDARVGENKEETGALRKAGLSEQKPYAFVLATNEDNAILVELGDLILYNEFEGQELEKITDYVDDDGLLIIPESCILAIMNNV